MAKRICVIGAGAAGLHFSHAAIREGFEVTLFESHSKPGGCASFFRRKTPAGGVCFDAGATVLWGLRDRSDLLSQLYSAWELPELEFLPHKELQCSMSETAKFTLKSSNPEAWIESLRNAFPAEKDRVWTGVERLRTQAQVLYETLSYGLHLPLNSLQAFRLSWRAFPKTLPILSTVFRGLNSNFSQMLDSWGASPEFRKWVEMNLLITLQAKSVSVHPLYAAMALFFYPLGAGSLKGGMFQLFETLKTSLQDKATVLMRHPVSSIEKRAQGFFIKALDQEYGPFHDVVSTIPRFNTQELYTESSIDNYSWEQHKTLLWGANVGYLLVKNCSAFPKSAFNHHASHESKGDFYFSFSADQDTKRAPQGYRAVTFSTHTPLGSWRGDENYHDHKDAEGQRGLYVFRERFPESNIIFHEFGTPRTFYRYTKRKEGFVGGLPLNLQNTFFNSPSIETRVKGLYQIGDTSFPGQSIFGCAVGALLCLEKICGRKLFPGAKGERR